jgi:hypothetical protein
MEIPVEVRVFDPDIIFQVILNLYLKVLLRQTRGHDSIDWFNLRNCLMEEIWFKNYSSTIEMGWGYKHYIPIGEVTCL